jgi:hypothetical protein
MDPRLVILALKHNQSIASSQVKNAFIPQRVIVLNIALRIEAYDWLLRNFYSGEDRHVNKA